ncbi:MAG: ATP-binding cassette domain-containing protein [Magnetospirillum sp.]|nr:ATP-binding cassette domain-containing protein [Magnetospirillum sp.]
MTAAAIAGPVRKQPSRAAESYQQHLAHSALGGFIAGSDLAACLLPLLKALGWKGEARYVAEALPHFANDLDLTGLRNVLAALNFSSRPERLRLAEIDPRLLPCLFLPDGGAALVVKEMADGVTVFDSDLGAERTLVRPSMKGTAYFFTQGKADSGSPRTNWFRGVIGRFRPLFWQTLVVTLLLNLASLSTPLFVMSVYDKIVATASLPMLMSFGIGVAIALAADTALRSVRARMLAFVGARLDNIMGNSILQQILALPPGFTERATIGAQVARVKDFESVREFFTGPLASVAMELPFGVLYFAMIAVLGGVLAVVPIVATLAFVMLGWLVLPAVRRHVAESSRAAAQRQEFLIESLGKVRALKLGAAESIFLERYRQLSATAAIGVFHSGMFTVFVGLIGNIVIVASGMVTIAMGVFGVIAGTMTMGNLIAAMMLVWRVLSPLQTAITLIHRIEMVRGSVRQIDTLMGLRPERNPAAMVAPLRNVKGRVAFSRVSVRYSNETDPALVGVSFEVEPGEVAAITGRNGSGKSTVLKLLLGLYSAQAGSIRIDNTDIRQIDPLELRHAIAYVPQTCNLFHGTVAQNLRLAHPTASESDIRWACELADVWEEIASLPRGLDSRIGDSATEHLPTSFVQKLSLARAYLKRSPIILFDEPVNGLDFHGDRTFMQALDHLRGQSTILMVTHRPSHLKIVDRILVFDSGYLRLAGLAEDVRARIPSDMI